MEDINEDEINLLDYVKIILKHKKLIACVVGVVVVVTIVISLIMTPTYEAKAMIAPATKTSDPSGMGMGAIAAQFGIATPSSSNMSEIVNLLKSDILKERTIKKYNLLPVLLEKKFFKPVSEDKKTWAGIRTLGKEVLKVTVNQKENSIQLSATFKDPRIAANILTYTLTELTDLMSGEARRVAETNKKYLEQEVERTADPLIKTKIYALIAQQIETSMMAEVKENFAFKVLDPPRVPDRKIKPKRAQMVMISFVVSIFLGIFVAFGKEYWVNHREELKRIVKS